MTKINATYPCGLQLMIKIEQYDDRANLLLGEVVDQIPAFNPKLLAKSGVIENNSDLGIDLTKEKLNEKNNRIKKN